jgi:hypothetical protein
MSDGYAIEMIRAEYTRAIGPMANVLLDEALAAFGADAETFPSDKLPELIERLGWEVHSERRRVEFQKETLRQLQHLR